MREISSSKSVNLKRIKAVFLSLIISFSFMITTSLLFSKFENMTNYSNQNIIESYSSHAPIIITSNDGFNSTNGVNSGNGSAGDPYLINYWDISITTEAQAIQITNTTAYAIIEYINITGSSTGTGIYLSNASNVIIRHVEISNTSLGIDISATCANITSIYNVTINVTGDGLKTLASSSIIENVNIIAGATGVLLEGASNTITSSKIHDCGGIGIRVSNSYNVINDTEVYSNLLDGIYLSAGSQNSILNSTIHDNLQNGINIKTQKNVLNDSKLFNNTKAQVYIQTSEGKFNNITYNNMTSSVSDYIMKIYNAPDNNIEYNNIENLNSNGTNPLPNGILVTGLSCLRNKIDNNNFSVNQTAIKLSSSVSQTEISFNNFTTGVNGIEIHSSSNNKIINNSISGGFISSVILNISNSINVSKNVFSESGNQTTFIVNYDSNYTQISTNSFSGGNKCVDVLSSKGVKIMDNSLGNFTSIGISLTQNSSGNVIESNVISNSSSIGTGVLIQGSSNNITKNRIALMRYGLNITGLTLNKTDNLIHSNNFTLNTIAGLVLDQNTSKNLIFNNVFINTVQNVNCGNNTNIFYNRTDGLINIVGGPNIGGNYWSTYSNFDANLDGFGETPYTTTNVVDSLPLVILPKVNSPGDKDYYQSIQGYVIPWKISKLGLAPTNPKYEVLLDNTSYLNGTWINNTYINVPVKTNDTVGLHNYTIRYSYDIGSNTQLGKEDTVMIYIRAPSYQILPVNTSSVVFSFSTWDLNITIQGNITSNNFYVERQNNTGNLMYQIGSTPGSADGFNIRIVTNESQAFVLNYTISFGYEDSQIDDAQIDPYLWNETSGQWVDPRTIGATYLLNRTTNIVQLTMHQNTSEIGEFIFIGTPILNVTTNKTYYNNTETIGVNINWFNVDNALLEIQIKDSSNFMVYQNTSWGVTNSSGAFQGTIVISSISGLDNDNFSLYIHADNGTHAKTNEFYLTFFVVDSVGPSITITTPENGSYQNETFFLGTYITDPNLDNSSYSYYIGPSKYPFSGNETIKVIFNLLSDGWYNITVEAWDYAKNMNNASIMIYKDGTPPVVTVPAPANNSYQNQSFVINTTVVEINLDSIYYRIDSYTNASYPFSGNGTLDSSAFDGLSEGSHYIVMYANDSAGNEHSYRIDFVKDTVKPFVNITHPAQGLITNSTFIMNTTIVDLNPNSSSMYYRVDSLTGSTYSFNGNETLNSSVFDSLSQGAHVVYIYTVDLAGNLNYSSLSFTKDTIIPGVSIIAPVNNTHFNSNFSIVALNDDIHSNATWYQIENESISGNLVYNGQNWTTFISVAQFNSLSDGIYKLIVRANDSAGNENETSILFTKDTVAPQITVNLPTNNMYYNSSFEINITVVDVNFNKSWYLVDGGSPVYFVGNTTISNFASLSQGNHTLDIYSNDLAGNINSSSLIFYKDTINPAVTLEDPSDGSYQNSPFLINVTIDEINLEYKWYIVDGNDSLKRFFNGSELIDEAIFNLLSEGSHSIIVYANDTAGNIGSLSFSFTKDTVAPSVVMISPMTNNSYFKATFTYRIDISDVNSYTSVYKIDSLSNASHAFAANTPQIFDNATFMSLSEGSHLIYFIGTDVAGNSNMTVLGFTKDTIKPQISIISPVNNSIFRVKFDLNTTVLDTNYNGTIWYQIEGRSANYSFDGNDTFYEFDNLTDGDYNLWIYSSDLAGNENQTLIVFTKDTIAPTIEIDTPANNGYFNSTYDLNVTITELHFDWSNLSCLYYQIDGGAPNIVYNGSGPLTEFGSLSEGFHYVSIVAIDVVGNNNSVGLNFTKDTVLPVYNIISPANNSHFNNTFVINITVTDVNHDKIILKIDDPGGSGVVFTGNGTLPGWGSLSEGAHVVYFDVYDKAGNLKNDTSLVFTKDTILPVLTLDSPSNNSIFNSAFSFQVNVTEINIDQANYRIGSLSIHSFTVNASNSMNISEWNALGEGNHLIVFWVLDNAGNNNSILLNFTKDTLVPSIEFTSPPQDQYFNQSFTIVSAISDVHLFLKWYNVDNGVNTTLVGNNITLDFSTLSEGIHHVYVFANDTASNFNSSTFTFTKDTILPNISVTAPSQNQIFNNAFVLNTKVIDSTAINMYYYIDNFSTGPTAFNGNESISGFDVLSEGSHDILLYANDSAGNINNMTLSFIKDTISPIITLINPVNESVFNSAFDINVSITELYFNETWYSIDSGALVSFSGNDTIANFSALSEGPHNLTIFANDTVNNVGQISVTFTKDISAPTITFNQTSNQTPYLGSGFVSKGDDVVINISAHDTFSNIALVIINVNITGTFISHQMSDLGNGSYQYTIAGESYYGINVTYYFQINDTLGNAQNSVNYSYFIVYDEETPVVVKNEFIQHDDNVSAGSNINVSVTLYNWNQTSNKSVILTLQIISPNGEALSLEYNDTINLAPDGSLLVTLNKTLPSGQTGAFKAFVQLKTDWLANGGYTIWVGQVTINVI
ncbi:MAG: right-handed parallel beta-helix repeat-containing protein [Promethearchaeota archaeon]